MVEIRPIARRAATLASLVTVAVALQACATRPTAPQGRVATYKVGKPYQVGGIWYVPREQPDYDQVGVASWYGEAFHMKATATGELFDMNAVSAAHTTLPLPSMVEVTNLDNGKKLVVRVNDRGPFVGDRIIDISREGARQLGYDRKGLARVRVRYLGRGDLPTDRAAGRRVAQAEPVVIPAAAPTDAPRPPVEFWTARGAPGTQVAAAPGPVTVAALAPLAATASLASPAPLAPEPTFVAAPAFRVQAGAFSDPQNAQRAVAQLTPTGQAVIEPLQRDGVTLYRVVVPGGGDEVSAEALRQRVIASGFADARVLRPF